MLESTENIKVLTQNCIRIVSDVGIIYIDPIEIKHERHDADYILITHDHYDHFSPEDIAKLSKDETVLVVPVKLKERALKLKDLVSRIETVDNEVHETIKDLDFETIPAYNISKSFHPRVDGWLGYILNIDGERIYIAGDTDATEEAKAVKCDVAIVPIGGTYTMNAKEAAGLVNIIHPKVAIPVHYGSIVGDKSDGEVFKNKVDKSIDVVFKIEEF